MDSLMKIERDLEKTATAKSIEDLVKANLGGGLALAGVTLILDFSSSMSSSMRNGRRRIDGLREAVDQIQQISPTSMIGFSNGAAFITTVLEPQDGTNLGGALKFAKESGVGRCIVISDGCPNDELYAMDEGKELGRCDCIFVGNPNRDRGREFLRRLALATGGTMFDGDLAEVKTLVGHVVALLGDGKEVR